jgi:hypothetical protein
MCAPWSPLTLSIWGCLFEPFEGQASNPDQLVHRGMAARCPRLGYICRICGSAAEAALELLISNPLDSRAPVAPSLVEWDLRPLVSNCTLRGSGFLEPLAQATRGLRLLGKEPGN